MDKKHIGYFDTLRIIAIFSVVLLHVAAANYEMDVTSKIWNISLFWNSLSRWGVPIFVMISGALFLRPSKELSIRVMYTKYIKRIFYLLVTWTLIYCFFRYCTEEMTLGQLIASPIVGYGHLWFLFMIIGLYAVTPFLRKITTDKRDVQYFIVLSIIFSFIVPTIYMISDSYTNLTGNDVLSKTSHFLFDKFHFSFTLEYVAYYVIGYYLANVKIAKKVRYVIYFLGLISFGFTYLYSLYISRETGSAWDIFHNMSLNVFFESLAIFILVKELSEKSGPSNRHQALYAKLGKYSLGIYLVHMIPLQLIVQQSWFKIFCENYYLSIPLIALLVFVLSLIITVILSKIPIIKKIVY